MCKTFISLEFHELKWNYPSQSLPSLEAGVGIGNHTDILERDSAVPPEDALILRFVSDAIFVWALKERRSV